MEKRQRGGVTYRRRFRNPPQSQKWLHHGTSGVHGKWTEGLGKATFKPTVLVVPEVPESSPDNRGVCGNTDFCQRYDNDHQTARKLVAGAPRQEKTDTLKSSPENTSDIHEETSGSENGTKEEMTYHENTTGKEMPCFGNLKEKEMSCLENKTQKEMPCPVDMNEKEMSCLEDFTEKGMSCTESMTEKGMSCIESMTEKEMSCPESAMGKESMSISSIPSAEATSQEKARLKVDNIYREITPEKTSESEPKADENTQKAVLDNKLLEELETLPIPEHLKVQIRNSACATEADVVNMLLKDFVEFCNSVNKMISQAAVSTLPNVSDQMKEEISTLLDRLFLARVEDMAERCLTDPWAEEEKKEVVKEGKSLMENVCRTDQPMDKGDAIDMALVLSQQNKLTNTTLTQLYTCLRDQPPVSLEDNAACSKEIKSFLSYVAEEGSLGWKSLKEGCHSKSAVMESDGSSSLKDNNSPWHLSELSVEGEQCRSPVENSFYFSTFASSSLAHSYLTRTADVSHVGGRGTDLKVILSLIQKFVRQVGGDSQRKGQTISSQKQKDADYQDKQKDVNGQTEKDTDDQVDKQKDMDLEEKEMNKSTVQRNTNVTDSQTEEVHEKSETAEGESKMSSITTLEANSEIMEKAEYEESEKGKKKQPTVVQPSTADEPDEPTKQQDSASIHMNAQTPPELLHCMADMSQPARTQQPSLKTEQRTLVKKMKGQTQQQTVDRKQHKKKKKNQRSAPKKKRGHQPMTGYKMTEKQERKRQMTSTVERKRAGSSTKRMAQETSLFEQHNPQQEEPCAAQRVFEEHVYSRPCMEAKDLDESLHPSFRHVQDFTNHKILLQGEKSSSIHRQRLQEIGKHKMLNNISKKSRECHQTKKTRPPTAGKRLPTLSGILKLRSLHQEESWYSPLHILKPSYFDKNERGQLPRDQDWLDVRGWEVRVRSAGESPHGTSQGQGQGSGNSTNSTGSGGGSSAQSWGGARPKTPRNSGGGGGGGDGDDRRPPTRNVPDSLPLSTDPNGQKVAPRRNYKRHRKKQHGAISNEQLCHCLGQAGQGMDTLCQSSGAGELNRCLRLCLHDTRCVTSPTDDDLTCCTCAILHSLLSHFSTAAHGEGCGMCRQLFTLVHFHILDCQAGWTNSEEEEEEERADSARNVCRRMRKARMFAGGGTVTVTVGKMWTKVRKYLSAALGPVLLFDVGIESEATTHAGVDEEESQPLPSLGDVAPSGESGRKSQDKDAVFQPDHQASADLTGAHGAVMPKAAASSKLCRRPSQKVVPQKTIPEEPGSPYSSPTHPKYPTQGEGSDQAVAAADIAQVSLPSTFPRQAETPEDGEDIMKYIRIFDERQKEQQPTTPPVSRNITYDPYMTQKTYGMKGTVSMPEPRDRFIQGEQTLSVEMHPVGTPGIGEVVYGTRHQLQLVARNWSQERNRCKASGICQYQHREEGVILHTFKKQLKILHTRYQKHHQWERLVHLGNGVTGKCHLCIDRSSNFKFCCKKVHILHYEDQELDIWSELDHPSVVRFYGALRHGEKIYMFAEFIDGGSLAALIKEQWLVGRRLSHWTSLNYFRQLLKALTYLQSKGVLHEDIKADNLLLRDGTTEIVLADFGAAQQIPHDHTPPNRYPVGSPAHWSPEKAASEGHGFSSDLWASACVLIHMLSGSPPWIARFPDAAILNYIIWSKPPPLDDLPADVKESVRDLLTSCLVKDKAIRPTAGQILSHHAFILLDQVSSFFSIAQHATVAISTSSHAAPVSVSVALQSAPQPVQTAPQSVLTALQPAQEAPPCQQTASQALQVAPHSVQASFQDSASNLSQQESSRLPREAGSDLRAHNAVSQSFTAPSPSESIPQARMSPFSPRPPVVRVVEIPRQSLAAQRQAEERCGPQSLPGSLTQSQDSPQGDPPVHRKSDPAISAPFTTEPGPAPSPQRKMGHVVLDPSSLEVKDKERVGGSEVTTQQMTKKTSGQQPHQRTSGLPLGEKRGAQHHDSEVKLPHQETQEVSGGRSHNLRESWLPLQPALWPDLPSPIFSLSSHTTGLSSPHSAAMNPSSGSEHHGYQAGSGSQMFFPNTPQAEPVRGRSTLTVPDPVPVGQAEGGSLSAARSVAEEGAEQTQLSSYGTALGSMEMGSLSQPSGPPARGEGHPSGSQGSGATSQKSDDQRVPVTRVTLTRSAGAPLQLRVALQEEERHSVNMHGLPENPSAGERSTVVSTTAIASYLPSDQGSASAAQSTTVPHLQATSANQQGMIGRAEHQPDILEYPALPALSLEDFQVTGSRRGIACLTTALSMIPEGVEQESVSPSVQAGSSGESSEGTMWNYIQDQFALLYNTDDQLLHSLRQQSENRPRLELYAPSVLNTEEDVREEVCRQPPMMILPRFELLQSSLSDSSTLRSPRIITSSGEYSGPSQSTLHGPGSTESSSSSALQRPRDEPDSAFPPVGSNNWDQRSSGNVQAGGPVNNNVQPPAIPGYSDEEQISSGDIFGSGPHKNSAFQEAYQYRKQQQQQQTYAKEMSAYQQPPVSSASPSQSATGLSKSMSKKQPNLRLNVAKPASITAPRTAGSLSHSRDVHTAEPGSSTSHQGDDAFLLHPGVSPMTASPLFPATPSSSSTPRHSEVRPRSRNESGSSASTPKSSTYDRQEQEWNTLQQQTPGLEDALLEDPMMASGSEVSSTHHLSLLYESQGDSNTSDQEENDVLSMLQESISDVNLGGHRLVFENAEGQQLFDMRVLDKNKGWKELATTFRSKIRDAGFRHFKVVQQDGSPVDYFAPYSPAITRVKVIEVGDEEDDMFSVCWCDRHLVY